MVRKSFHIVAKLVTMLVSGVLAVVPLLYRSYWIATHMAELDNATGLIGFTRNTTTLQGLRLKFEALLGWRLPVELWISDGLRILSVMAGVVCAVSLLLLVVALIRWALARSEDGDADELEPEQPRRKGKGRHAAAR